VTDDAPRAPAEAPRDAPSAPVLRRAPHPAWAALLLVAVAELAWHATTRARVAPLSDWRAAAAFVRAQKRPGDLVTSAPGWTDPILRHVMGDAIGFAEAGRTGTAKWTRMWALTVRGELPEDAPPMPPELERGFGRVRVVRWNLGPSPVLFDLVENVRRAEVVRVEGGRERPCTWRRREVHGGGLGYGTLEPAESAACDPRRPWLWVGATMAEDLDLRPRYCVWQHPQGPEPIRVTYRDVPLGTRLVLHGGMYSEHERMGEHGPVTVVVKVDGSEVGRMVHRDLEGWKRMEARTAEREGQRGDVSVEVMADDPHLRTFCWSATIEHGPRRETRGTAARAEVPGGTGR
jgi:uncharacterized protein YndB with AHSA1/START domain